MDKMIVAHAEIILPALIYHSPNPVTTTYLAMILGREKRIEASTAYVYVRGFIAYCRANPEVLKGWKLERLKRGLFRVVK